jgi:hypothetical protein
LVDIKIGVRQHRQLYRLDCTRELEQRHRVGEEEKQRHRKDGKRHRDVRAAQEALVG